MAHDDRYVVRWVDKDSGYNAESRELTEKQATGYAKILEEIGHKVSMVQLPKKR